ncbi:MAG: MgtC/SapB family protein [Acidobacteria bacterium]|nr:MgtC/SapB family protein [Acidobacteriota bacterium]
MAPPPGLPSAIQSVAEALLIGLLVGFEREASQVGEADKHAGFRDFILISLTGSMCGLLALPWLTGTALAAIALLLAVSHHHNVARIGVTTEMAAVATFCLGYLTSTQQVADGAMLAIGLTIVIAAFLEAKRAMQKLVRETITEGEFRDTLRFLAIIFIIFPLLPAGDFGPYQFFSPHRVWLFVILVSSISYVGYFLQKFLGAGRGLTLAGVLGGIASTTAATTAFAKDAAENPANLKPLWRASTIANTVWFPRVLAILFVMNPALAMASLAPLAAMTAAGLALSFFLARREAQPGKESSVPVGNPFRLAPALKFGVLFTLILLAGKASAAEFGTDAIYWASIIAGSFDVDAVAVTLCDLLGGNRTSLEVASAALLLALASNAVLKSALAFYAGTRAFGWRVAAAFSVMFAAGAGVWLVRF